MKKVIDAVTNLNNAADAQAVSRWNMVFQVHQLQNQFQEWWSARNLANQVTPLTSNVNENANLITNPVQAVDTQNVSPWNMVFQVHRFQNQFQQWWANGDLANSSTTLNAVLNGVQQSAESVLPMVNVIQEAIEEGICNVDEAPGICPRPGLNNTLTTITPEAAANDFSSQFVPVTGGLISALLGWVANYLKNSRKKQQQQEQLDQEPVTTVENEFKQVEVQQNSGRNEILPVLEEEVVPTHTTATIPAVNSVNTIDASTPIITDTHKVRLEAVVNKLAQQAKILPDRKPAKVEPVQEEPVAIQPSAQPILPQFAYTQATVQNTLPVNQPTPQESLEEGLLQKVDELDLNQRKNIAKRIYTENMMHKRFMDIYKGGQYSNLKSWILKEFGLTTEGKWMEQTKTFREGRPMTGREKFIALLIEFNDSIESSSTLKIRR